MVTPTGPFPTPRAMLLQTALATAPTAKIYITISAATDKGQGTGEGDDEAKAEAFIKAFICATYIGE